MVGRPNRQSKEPKVPKLTNIDKSKLRTTLDSELCNLNVNWDGLQSEADLDGIVNKITAIAIVQLNRNCQETNRAKAN